MRENDLPVAGGAERDNQQCQVRAVRLGVPEQAVLPAARSQGASAQKLGQNREGERALPLPRAVVRLRRQFAAILQHHEVSEAGRDVCITRPFEMIILRIRGFCKSSGTV